MKLKVNVIFGNKVQCQGIKNVSFPLHINDLSTNFEKNVYQIKRYRFKSFSYLTIIKGKSDIEYAVMRC